jgi:hypothetical protein
MCLATVGPAFEGENLPILPSQYTHEPKQQQLWANVRHDKGLPFCPLCNTMQTDQIKMQIPLPGMLSEYPVSQAGVAYQATLCKECL